MMSYLVSSIELQHQILKKIKISTNGTKFSLFISVSFINNFYYSFCSRKKCFTLNVSPRTSIRNCLKTSVQEQFFFNTFFISFRKLFHILNFWNRNTLLTILTKWFSSIFSYCEQIFHCFAIVYQWYQEFQIIFPDYVNFNLMYL